MVTAVIPDADDLIAERRASGNDRFDEVIEGVYFEGGVGFPDDYVIPDLVVYRSEVK